MISIVCTRTLAEMGVEPTSRSCLNSDNQPVAVRTAGKRGSERTLLSRSAHHSQRSGCRFEPWQAHQRQLPRDESGSAPKMLLGLDKSHLLFSLELRIFEG